MRSFVSEFLGTLLLVATVVGSGIMAENLSMGNQALALLANAIATGAILYVLITIFSEISGAHFNPVVSLIMFTMKKLSFFEFFAYITVQIIGGILGTFLAHYMFEMSIIQFSTNVRTGSSQYFSEVIAAFGLLLTFTWVETKNRFRRYFGRILYYCCLLVYFFNQLCQSGCYYCKNSNRYFLWYPTWRHYSIYYGANYWWFACISGV